MPNPDRFEIGSSKDLVGGVIFGVEFLILARKTKMLGEMVFFGCMRGCFGALMRPPMVGNGRYANSR